MPTDAENTTGCHALLLLLLLLLSSACWPCVLALCAAVASGASGSRHVVWWPEQQGALPQRAMLC